MLAHAPALPPRGLDAPHTPRPIAAVDGCVLSRYLGAHPRGAPTATGSPKEGHHMTAQELRSRLVSRIWQSIAQSNAEVSSIPREELETLVDAIADGVIDTLNGLAPQVGADWDATAETEEEITLWAGRPLFSLVERYTVSTERIRVRTGMLSKENENIELVRVQDIDYRQSLSERIFGVGDVHVRSSDPSHPMITLRNVRHPERVHDIIRRAMLSARRRYRFSFHEEM